MRDHSRLHWANFDFCRAKIGYLFWEIPCVASVVVVVCDLPDGSCYDKVRAVMLLMVAVAPAGGVSAGPSCLVPPNWEGWPAGWTDVFMRGMASLATGNYSLGISRNSRFPTSFSIRWLFFVLPRGCHGLLLSLMVDETLSVRCWPGPAGEKLVCALLVWLLMAWAGAIWVHLILDTSGYPIVT